MNSSRIGALQTYKCTATGYSNWLSSVVSGLNIFGGKGKRSKRECWQNAGRVREEKTEMSITFENDIADEGVGNELGLFDDDDPFNLPPPLPPLSPQRDDDPFNQNGDKDQTNADDKTEANKKRRVKRLPRPKLDEVR